MLFEWPSVPDAHSLLLLVDFTAQLPVNLLMLASIPLLILFLKQPCQLCHKGADRAGNPGDVHWFYGIHFFGFIYHIGGTLFFRNGRIVIPAIRFFLLVRRI